MGITSALVLFAVIWFVVLFCVLPLRFTSQAEAGEIVPGTHASAPANAQIGKKAKLTTIIAAVLWVIVAGTIVSGVINVRDLDWLQRMTTPERSETDG